MTKRASFMWNWMDEQHGWIKIVKFTLKSRSPRLALFERCLSVLKTTVMAFEVKWPKSHLDWNQSKSELLFFSLHSSRVQAFKVKIYGSHNFGVDVYLRHFFFFLYLMLASIVYEYDFVVFMIRFIVYLLWFDCFLVNLKLLLLVNLNDTSSSSPSFISIWWIYSMLIFFSLAFFFGF